MVFKNVFVPGLKVGAAHLPYQPEKAYAFVEDAEAGWRVYLRSAVFIHEAGKPFKADRFIVVKKFGADPRGKVWEPPKGQMEGKDHEQSSRSTRGRSATREDRGRQRDIMTLLLENVRREVEEEAKIHKLLNVRHTGLIYQATEPDFPPNTYFQYHIFQAFVEPKEVEAAAGRFAWLHAHPKAWEAMKSDRREKDALGWYRGAATKMFGRWAPGILRMYLRAMSA